MVVFIDYQNAYKRARECFFSPSDRHTCGQFHPLQLGKTLCAEQEPDWELAQVRVYCGKPSNEKDPKGYAARRRQIARWEVDAPVVHVVTRPLRYPHRYPSEPAQEKGVDVALAIDCVTMAIRDQYDIGIIMSEDTDLRPALEFVHTLQDAPEIEVACWEPLFAPTHSLTVPGQRIESHLLDHNAYQAVQDQKDYGAPLPRLPHPRQ